MSCFAICLRLIFIFSMKSKVIEVGEVKHKTDGLVLVQKPVAWRLHFYFYEFLQ
jgi:hypothetical protein